MLQSLVLLLLAGLTSSAAAQDYPSRQITLIAPFAAGGSTDLVARVVSEGLRAKLGQPVIVENKPGGTGVIGAREVVKADPDGYTLLLANAGATVIPAAMSNSYPIDLNKDLLCDWPDGGIRRRRDSQEGFASELDAGVHRLCQGKSWQAQFRHLWRR